MKTVSLDQHLRKRSLKFARELAAAYSGQAPPFNLKLLLDRFNIVSVRETVLNQDALLFESNRKFVIELNGAVSLARRRMSLAHEFGHLILNEMAGEKIGEGHSNQDVERFCNQLAGEILCPEGLVRQYFEKQHDLGNWKRQVRCRTIIDAARDFGVSVEVIAKRVFFDLGLAPAAIALIWRFVENRKTQDGKPALRVTAAWHNLQGKTFIPLNKTVPSGSVVEKAFQREGSFCRVEHISLGTIKGSFEVEASGFMSFPFRSMSPPSRAVLSLLT